MLSYLSFCVFPSPPKEGRPIVISSWGHVSEFGFDMFVHCYEHVGHMYHRFWSVIFSFDLVSLRRILGKHKLNLVLN
jgi:hypothetical protein